MLYGLRFAICRVIISNSNPLTTADSGNVTTNVANVGLVVLMIAFCLSDGMEMPFRVKTTLLFMTSLVWSLHAFEWTLLQMEAYVLNVNPWRLNLTELAVPSLLGL